MVEILACLKKYGQRLDLEIAKEIGVPLTTVRLRLAQLAATGAIITCRLTRYEKGKRVDAWQCRVSGYVPPRAPGPKQGRKPASQGVDRPRLSGRSRRAASNRMDGDATSTEA